MDQKLNTHFSSCEYIAELSDIIKAAVLREIGVHKPKDNISIGSGNILCGSASNNEIVIQDKDI